MALSAAELVLGARMAWVQTHWLAAALLGAYTLMLFYNAYFGGRASTEISGYYLGGRKMGGVAIGFSFFATFASTNSYIGHAGKGYAYGLPWLVLGFSLVVLTWVSWRWVAPTMRRFAAAWDALTLPDFLHSRYAQPTQSSQLLSMVSAVVIVFASILYLIAIFKGAGHLFQLFLDISYEQGVLLTLIVVMLYTSIGGFVSVVRTDVVQGVLMLFGSVLMFYFVTQAAGGVTALGALSEQPDKEFLFELNGGIAFVVLLGISLSGGMKLLVDPRQLSRFFALRDQHEIRRAKWISLVGLLIVFGSLMPIGIYAQLLLDNVSDTDLIVPTLVADAAVFPVWAGDFLIVAIVAAAMSSMDSVLLVAASTLFKNLVTPVKPVQRQVMGTRWAVVGFAVVSALLALNPPGDIVEITIFSGSLYAVCFLPAVLFGLHWRKGNVTAVLGSMLSGVSVLVVWLWLDLQGIAHEVFPALLVSLLVFMGISVFSPPAVSSQLWKKWQQD